MKIVIIGSGNVATVLGRKISLAEHEILQVISQNEEHAKILAGELNCDYSASWTQINGDADFYIVAISDNGLNEINRHLNLQNKLVVHTAGSVSKDVLKDVSKNYGSLYPLQRLKKEVKEVPEIPLLADGNTEDDLTLIYDFAKTISGNVKVADDFTRLKLHIAAIIVNNFTNHLYALAENYCKQEKVDFTLLFPLIEETVKRLYHASPGEMQTGPALRNDTVTLEKHLATLSNYPALRKVYQLLSQSIAEFHSGRS